jgi:hypothetical protein
VERGALPPPHNLHGIARWRVADLEAIWSGTTMDQEEFEA